MSLLGKVVGDYKILKKIGAGGMGVVYKGIHVRLEQLVAIKDLSPDLASNPEMRERFIREAKIQARLNHPNVVNVHNLLEHEGSLLLVMEFVEGRTLDQIIQERGALPYNEAVHITRQVLDALDFMHSKGVIHRDLKPGNIIITPEGRVKVTDFGIAKATTEQGHTRAGTRLGTLWYMSPEQVKGKPVDARSDLYAMGITLYQMVTGKLPFFGNSDFEIMKAHTETPPPDPKKIKKDLPKSISSVILKLLEKNPDNRFQSAKKALKALYIPSQPDEKQPAKASARKPAKGLKVPKIPSPQSEKKISPLVWIIIGIILLAGIAVFTYWMMNQKQAIIPVVKAPPPKHERPVETTSTAAPDSKAVSEKKESKEDVTPVIEEIEQKLGTTDEKKNSAEPEKQPSQKNLEENGMEHSPPLQETSPGGSVIEMTPSGELKAKSRKHHRKTRKVVTAQPEPKKNHPKPRKTHKIRAESSVSEENKLETPPPSPSKKKKKGKNKLLTIDKQIGHFYKSIKKSLKALEHPHKQMGTSDDVFKENEGVTSPEEYSR